MSDPTDVHYGGCVCGLVRFRMDLHPLIVHCCHCSWCQRQTGSAFAVNVLIEADQVHLLKGKVFDVEVPSPSGANQRISRCPNCQVAVWSNYLALSGGIGELVRFVRAGALDNPNRIYPDVHIYTSSKQPWVFLPPDALTVKEYYKPEEVWTKDSLERRRALLNEVKK